MPRSAVSDLVCHCLPITLLRISQLQWVKVLCWVNNSNEMSSCFSLKNILKKLERHTLQFCLPLSMVNTVIVYMFPGIAIL